MGTTSDVPQWINKYITASEAGSLKVLDFSTCKTVAAHDWQCAQEAEHRELAARPAAQAAAARLKYAQVSVPTALLNDGHKLPLVGLGTWKADRGQVRQAVHEALQAGHCHIDCAAVYQNEEEVGEALDLALGSGCVRREELFICSKVWNNDHAPERVRAACLRSLKALKLSYLDLYMVHWPVTGNVGPEVVPSLQETWRAMEGLVRQGLVRSIGVSNFSARKLQLLMEGATIQPAVCQVEVHPYHRNDALLAWCRQRGIHVTAYSPLGSPDSESIFPRSKPLRLLEDPTLKEMAQRLGKDMGQVLIRWALQHGTSVIPKSTSRARIRGNLQVLDWELSQDDYAKLSSLACQQRMVNGELWLNPRGPYRTLEELWDEPEAGEGAQGLPSPTPPAASAGAAAAAQAPAAEAPTGAASCSASALPVGTQSQQQARQAVPPEPPLTRHAVLNDGNRMPRLGLGTWKSAPGQVKAAVEAAVRQGYRHIDCAEVYQNEHEVGEALGSLLSEGVVAREELWVTSKVWNTNHGEKGVERAVRRSLKNLRLTNLDLYLIHWPASGNKGPSVEPPLQETWRAMEGLVRQGLVRSIGVSNFSARKLQLLMEGATIQPAVCQVEVHPYHRNDALLAWCRQRGVHVTAFSPLGSPDSESIFKREAPVLLQDPQLQEVAQRLGRSPAQVLIRWALQHGTSVLPKSTSPGRIQENGDVWGWELSAADFTTLSALGSGLQYRMVHGAFLLSPEGPYTTLEELWDE